MRNQKLRVGYFQFNPVFGDVKANLGMIVQGLRKADADLIVLPELATTGYYFKDRNEVKTLAEDAGSSASVSVLTDLCKDRDMYLISGFAERAGSKLFNSALLVGPYGLIQVYRKLHLFGTEKDCFDPGNGPLEVRTVRGIKIGMMICFDWFFPEVARILAVRGADIICHPANLVLDYCQHAMLTRCIENHIFSITANRFGADIRPHGTIGFTGKSQITTPKGKLLQRAPAQRRQLFVAEIDPGEARNKQITAKNHLLNDRRPEYYSPLAEVK